MRPAPAIGVEADHLPGRLPCVSVRISAFRRRLARRIFVRGSVTNSCSVGRRPPRNGVRSREFGQRRPSGRLDNRHIGIIAREPFDRFDRLPKRHDKEFDSLVRWPAEQIGADVSAQGRQARNDGLDYVALVGIGPVVRCLSTPDPRDHVVALPGMSALSELLADDQELHIGLLDLAHAHVPIDRDDNPTRRDLKGGRAHCFDSL
jgi:hypothetical protein